jgi:hypothetical protein
MFFKVWSGFLGILGFEGGEDIKSFMMFFYLLSLGILVIVPKVKKILAKPKDKKYSKEEVASLLLERIGSLMHLREDALFEIHQIKLNILRDQMDYAENTLEASKNDMLKAYGTALDAKLERKEIAMDSRSRAMNMLIYSGILDRVYASILAETRRAFRNNGFDDMSDLEFDVYIKQITGVCLSKGESVARQHYNEHVMIISYDEGKSTIDPSKIFEQTSEVFKKARRVTVKASRRMDKIESEYRTNAKELMTIETH